MKSRAKAILACGSFVVIFVLLFSLYGYEKTWRLWNIPTMSPHFADVRTITGGLESLAQGFDPMIKNPGDPWKRRFNYPKIWQSLYYFGIDHSHTTYIGLVFILSFLVGVCLVLPNADNITLVLVLAAILSPAVLLGIERGNSDLFIFLLIAISVVTIQKWHLLSLGSLIFGITLKLFPIFGCAVLLRVSRSLLLKYITIIFIFLTFYICLTYSDILMIRKATPQYFDLSYGLNVFWMMSKIMFSPKVGLHVKYLSYVIILLALLWAFAALYHRTCIPNCNTEMIYLDAFRAGSAIYFGTFLVANNFDYRLMFLIFTIPQLTIWVKCFSFTGDFLYISIISSLILVCEYVSLWFLLIAKILFYLPNGNLISFVLDEFSNWVVFVGLLYLFFWSMPEWVKGYAQTWRSLLMR